MMIKKLEKTSVAQKIFNHQKNNEEASFSCTSSLHCSGIFAKPVESVFERLQRKEKERENEQRETQMLKPNRMSLLSLDISQENCEEEESSPSKIENRLPYPIVPLGILERMQLVFQLYELRGQRRRRSLSCFYDAKQCEEDEMNYLASLIENKEKELEMRGGGNRYGSNESFLTQQSTCGTANNIATTTTTTTTTTPGIPFSVFERFIAGPFFDFLFPLCNSQQHLSSFMDNLNSSCRSPITAITLNSRLSSKTQKRARTYVQQRRPSQMKALENLFCVMDTNCDGFLSWDEFSSYILQSGQQLLLADEYRRDDFAEKTSTADFSNGNGKKKARIGSVTRVAANPMKFAPTPVNTSVWQQQYPLVRCLFHMESITRLIFCRRGRRYITTGLDGLVKLWRPDPRLVDAHGRPAIVHERNLFAAGSPIIDMVLVPESVGDAEILAVTAMDCTVTLLCVSSGEVLKTFIGRWASPLPSTDVDLYATSTTAKSQSTRAENYADLSVSKKNDSKTHVFGGLMVLRPTFKVRAYRREAIEIFFTDTSRYFAGLGVVAPTYEHLESRNTVKLDVLLNFGENTHKPIKKDETSCFTASFFASGNFNDTVGVTGDDNDDDCDDNDNDDCHGEKISDDACDEENIRVASDTSGGDCVGFGDDINNNSLDKNASTECYLHDYNNHKQRQFGKRIFSSGYFSGRSRGRAGEKCWFARSVALCKCKRAHSTSILKNGVFLLLGFDTGVLQIYPMRAEWFAISSFSTTRVEPPAMHEPVISLPLHRASIISILTSEPHDLLMTASNDGTVVIRHISRVHVPYVTLGDGVPFPGTTLHRYSSGHTKRITCMCLNSSRSLIVTGGADRCVFFWNFSSSRALCRIDLSTFLSNSSSSGIPIDVSFSQPRRQPLLLLILDTRRIIYFVDSVSYACLNILYDNTPASLRAGHMLCARYDSVDERLILGGRYLRVWEMNRSDEYPPDYCGHRRAIIGVAYQREWGLWVSADDSLIIIWNVTDRDQREFLCNNVEKSPEGKVSNYSRSRSNSARQQNMGSSPLMFDVSLVRSWNVDGGICALAVEQGEFSHVFVALVQKQCILEYNIFSGCLLRSFAFPKQMNEILSLACGISAKGASSLRQKSFLCGTFERENSKNGTTALYSLLSGNDVISAAELTGTPHRYITTNAVGVSCAVIVAALGLVVVGHRGGISSTPVDEVTTCPIMFTRLTDPIMRKKNDTKGTKKHSCSTTSLRRQESISPFATSFDLSTRETFPGTLNAGCGLGTALDTQGQASGEQPGAISFDLVALFPGPLLHDPAIITREFMQHRERYLFWQEALPTSAGEVSFQDTYKTPSTREKKEEEDVGNSRKNRNLGPHLPLFSDEFIASASGNSCNFGVFLREQLSSLGYVGVIVPVGKTEFVVSGSDDGLLQFWDLCSMSEVARFRATLGLNAVTSIDVSEDSSHVAVADASGCILLLDTSAVSWQSMVPLDKRIPIENDITVLRRWRGHKQSVVSVQFVQQNYHSPRSEAFFFSTASRSTRMLTTTDAFSNCAEHSATASGLRRTQKTVSSDNNNNNTRNKPTSKDKVADSEFSSHGCKNDTVTASKTIFLCTGSEDSHIYIWRWEAFPCLGGSVYCVGCFGTNAESPLPALPLDKLTKCVWREMEVVRKAYVTERLLAPGGVLSEDCSKEAIANAVNVIKDDLRLLKEGVITPKHVYKRRVAVEPHLLNFKGSGYGANFFLQKCKESEAVCGSCPSTFVLAFDDGLYYDCDLAELLERLLKELEVGDKKPKIQIAGEKRRSRSAIISSQNNVTGNTACSTFDGPHVALVQDLEETKRADATLKFTSSETPVLEQQNTRPLQSATSSTSLSTLPPPPPPPPPLLATAIAAARQYQHSSLSSFLHQNVLETPSDLQGNSNKQSSLREAGSCTANDIAGNEHFHMSLSSAPGAQHSTTFLQSLHGYDNQRLCSREKSSVLRDGSRETQACDDKWNRLPQITVSFASSPPLPRLRRGDEAEAENATPQTFSSNPLPLLSQVIRQPSGKLGTSSQYGSGVKVLLKEQPKRRSCRSALFSDVKMQHLSSDLCDNSPENLAIKRREKKRLNEMWGSARIMGTLMKWKAPNRTMSASHSGTVSDSPHKKDKFNKPVLLIEKPQSVDGPMFIPPSLGISSPLAMSTSSLLSERKILAQKLHGEMKAMKTKLQTELREKQLLVAQERIENEDVLNRKSQGGV